jgi:hypothetical protein
MVYCGKPSKACAECRARRTKVRVLVCTILTHANYYQCDTLTPSCSQCIRAGRSCTGYRSESDLMFRDQTIHYAKKSRSENESVVVVSKRKRKPARSVELAEPAPQSTATQLMQMATCIPFPFELHTPVGDQAACYFFRNYVLDDSSTNGPFQYLNSIYNNEIIGPAMRDSIEALGLVGLGNFWQSPEMKFQANRKYNSALRLVSSRLRSEQEAKENQTLVAVMLLGLYEVYFITHIKSARLTHHRPTPALGHSQWRLGLNISWELHPSYNSGERTASRIPLGEAYSLISEHKS